VLSSFVTLLREGFEVTLLVAIVLAYLVQIGRPENKRRVWYGVDAALLVSVVVGGTLFATVGGLEGRPEQIFEGVAMWVAVGFLTYMVLWMQRESRTASEGELLAWVTYVLAVGYAFLRPQPIAEGSTATSPATRSS
jgi:high-affinity iron transporter